MAIAITVACNKENKEVVKTEKGKQVTTLAKGDQQADPREEIRKDAGRLASALCRLRKARAVNCSPSYIGMNNYICNRVFNRLNLFSKF